MEDLWAFNEKIVAAAIVNCPIPVVAAIGHETDTTIAELVADERCATPTQAAMRLIPDACALLEQVEALSSRLRGCVDRLVTTERRRVESAGRHGSAAVRLTVAAARARVDRLGSRLDQHRPAAAHARREVRLAEAQRRLVAAMRTAVATRDLAALEQSLTATITRDLRRRADSLAAAERTLSAVSPLRVLARGYSVTTRADGRAVRSPLDVRPGEPIATRLADGTIHSTVDGPASDLAPSQSRPVTDSPRKAATERRPPPPRRESRGQDNAPSLFD
jgi:exodeoxyribonuclease VII large subunit